MRRWWTSSINDGLCGLRLRRKSGSVPEMQCEVLRPPGFAEAGFFVLEPRMSRIRCLFWRGVIAAAHSMLRTAGAR